MTRICLILLTLALAACSTSGRPLPLVDKGDPTWPLTPDRLEFGALPK
jgi:hypothetical protein